MGKPIVLYENVLSGNDAEVHETYNGVTQDSAFPVSNALSPFTYTADSWVINRGSSNNGRIDANLNLSTISGAEVNCAAFVVSGVTEDDLFGVTFRYTSSPSDVSGTSIGGFINKKNGVHIVKFPSTYTAGYYRVQVIGIAEATSDNGPIVISNICMGKAMEFEKCIMKSYAPLDYNRATEFLTNESGTGQFMGRSIVRRNHESSVSFDLMSAAWVRSTFQPFVRHARTKPYFFAWNYDDYPNEVNYVWTDEDIGVSYTGDRDKMSASWKMRGLGNDPE